MRINMTSTEKGRRAETYVRNWLVSKGLEVSLTNGGPYDMVVNGWRCEVKMAPMNSKGKWTFNIHRHGKLNELEVDYYIFSLENVPYCKASIYLIKKAPMSCATFEVSVRSLIVRYSEDVHNVKPLFEKPLPLVRKEKEEL
jgi:hypothetical protein